MQRSPFPRIFAITFVLGLLMAFAAGAALAQSTSGNVAGTVTDSTGAAIANATVVLANPVSGYSRTVTTDTTGQFRFVNIPFNPYRLGVTGSGFQPFNKLVQVNSVVQITLPVRLQVAGSTTSVDVDAPSDLVENDPTAHTDIDRSMIDHLPLESASSELSSIVTLASPGVAADSNGLMHGLGDHAENSFNIDGQPITDQQSKVFSNQVPAAAVQSLEVIEGAPPAEYGDKTSLVVKATTRSGQGVLKPTGGITLSYGTFGSGNLAFDLAYGGKNWGNFIAANGLESGRFLDAPEFAVYHDKGNEENFFDRFDYQLSNVSSVHTNVQYTRSWFQTPNSFDSQFGFVQSGENPTVTDQRSKIETFDLAPTYTRTIGAYSVFNFGPYIRRDAYNYYPSNNPLSDLGPANLQQESVAQQRSLTNAGVHSDWSYVKGINNVKIGGMYAQTFLRENDQVALVDPTLNAPCLDDNSNALPGNPNPCANPNPNFNPVLFPFDLTRGGKFYAWHGQTDVKQLALYAQDQITIGNWLFNAGIRGDFYNGLAIQRQAEPRAGISYNVKKTNTVLRVSYARTQETPFNENLVLSSQGCLDPVLNGIFSQQYGSCIAVPFNPGFRNEFHAGLQQGIGRHFVIDGEYIWKYTHNAYDFSVLGATPITFPIEWQNSKIPGVAVSGTLTEVKGLSARVTMSSVAARFFTPQLGGVGAVPTSTITAADSVPFRIDHDEKFNETTHVEYKMPFRKSLYYSFNWKFDSGLVAGAVPCFTTAAQDSNTDCDGTSITLPNGQQVIDLSGLDADQQFQAGLTCNGVKATQTQGFQSCSAAGLSSKLVTIPAPGTEDADHNPPRVASRNLFDMALGDDNVYHFGDDAHYRIGARVTAINVTNKYALYNFLSTFSGTHYVSPRTVTGEISFNF